MDTKEKRYHAFRRGTFVANGFYGTNAVESDQIDTHIIREAFVSAYALQRVERKRLNDLLREERA